MVQPGLMLYFLESYFMLDRHTDINIVCYLLTLQN